MTSPETYPAYPPAWGLLPKVLVSYALGRARSFRSDTAALVSRLQPPLEVLGRENLPQNGPGLVVVNHYYRPGFDAWWIAFAISASLPQEARWVMTAERRYEGLKRGAVMRPIEKRILQAVAKVYGFFPTPAIPPLPQEAKARGEAVRRVVETVRSQPNTLLALAPEGQDIRSGGLGLPPPGGGRFMLHLNRLGLRIYPAGVYEDQGCLFLRFGPSFDLDISSGLAREEQDKQSARKVMQAIAGLLPEKCD